MLAPVVFGPASNAPRSPCDSACAAVVRAAGSRNDATAAATTAGAPETNGGTPDRSATPAPARLETSLCNGAANHRHALPGEAVDDSESALAAVPAQARSGYAGRDMEKETLQRSLRQTQPLPSIASSNCPAAFSRPWVRPTLYYASNIRFFLTDSPPHRAALPGHPANRSRNKDRDSFPRPADRLPRCPALLPENP